MAAAPPAPIATSGAPTRVVCTLFYKATTPRSPQPHPDAAHHTPSDTLTRASLESLAGGVVPTNDLNQYPLEPPTPGPNPLDNLFGAYISQSCLTDFFRTLDVVLPGFQDKTAAHRVLDSIRWPRVVEVSLEIPAGSSASIADTLKSLRQDETISRFEREWNVEAIWQGASVFRTHKRLAVFDMDSTLIQQEVIDEVARHIGVEAQVSAITAAAMNGELDFEQSLRRRCALLKGVPVEVWENIRKLITPTPGAVELVKALKRLGYKTAVLSGGFTPVTGWFAQQLGLDYAFANHLVVSEDGKTLTGELTGEIVHAERKRQHVREIAEKEGILLEQVLVVGDGANDLPMMGIAGLGIAYNAKARVQMEAPARLNSESLLDVLYLLGFSKSEQEELLR
ncbi:Phosphoserine phosphatase SerB [Lasiodiplodia theobromae]|uniref:phosphoserine phosphatase n=1 Tax=Lasiodiplodia theobromae TaxID=45133 RepID=A0A5N5DS86_9PEZI|nr:Phosphoserine phosphatase [Lasiodiplodia theobromae]KAB2580231.1 putative phosphoserine phosphatase [Lasiodiplodia theobromae]KAF4541228.1 Phosphoserine phosphatase [Lasiodiplodia theobromae]KAF9632234.1 Phosphoserine phosphatase SerB [Lasiodiplodia theobromae]